MPEVPDRIYIDKKDRDLYQKLNEEEITTFKDKGGRRTRKEQFLFALSIGFKNGVKRKLETKEGFFLVKDLHPEDEALLNTIAVYDSNSVEILSNKGEVYKIVEEYAHAGIRLLCEKIKSTTHGSFDKHLEKELHDIYSKLKLDSEE